MSLLRNATFGQLATLDAVARLGSVSLAAASLNRTQPALSIQLGLLEQLAGTPIVERTGRGIRLTAAGEVLAQYASRVLETWREAGEEIDTLSGVFSGTLRVGAVTTADYLLPPLLVTFANDNPKVNVKLQVGNRDEIVRLLASQDIDVAIMGRPPKELRTVSHPFAKHPMGFIAAPSHPLMSRKRIDLAALANANLLVRERGSGSRVSVERLFKAKGLSLRAGSELSSNEAIKQLCAAGFGVGFVSLFTCMIELDAGVLSLLAMPGNPIERNWHVMHLRTRQLPHVATAFEQFLVTSGQTEIDRHLAERRAALQRGRPSEARAVATAARPSPQMAHSPHSGPTPSRSRRGLPPATSP